MRKSMICSYVPPRRFFARAKFALTVMLVFLLGGNAVANSLNFDSTPVGMPPEDGL